mmetsp:Transcript_9679/g.23653  ORF Transcript_9679/g.23653 Transcript_9679/m.23653 type:complete len:228 (+) Transcript_9679:414-1097(+)
MGMIGATCTVGVISVQPNGNGRLRRLQSTGDLRIEFTVFICGTVECNGEGADQSVAPPPFLRRNLQLEACVPNLSSKCNDVDNESTVDALFDGFSKNMQTAIQDGSLISDLRENSSDLSDLLNQTTAMGELTPPLTNAPPVGPTTPSPAPSGQPSSQPSSESRVSVVFFFRHVSNRIYANCLTWNSRIDMCMNRPTIKSAERIALSESVPGLSMLIRGAIMATHVTL